MTRKDSEKDSERPHYYSQFWLDVAAGRRVIGLPKSNEESDIETEPELEPELESITLRRPGRSSDTALSDGYEETIAHPEVEPETEDYIEPELDEMELKNDEEDLEIPAAVVDETEIPDVDLAPLEEEDEDFFEEEEEEEDEDSGWGGARGRKKPKPGRQTKQPKKIKRERRGF